MSTSNSFHGPGDDNLSFETLPMEVQIKIWTLALPAPRLVHLCNIMLGKEETVVIRTPWAPSAEMFNTCKLSARVYAQYYSVSIKALVLPHEESYFDGSNWRRHEIPYMLPGRIPFADIQLVTKEVPCCTSFANTTHTVIPHVHVRPEHDVFALDDWDLFVKSVDDMRSIGLSPAITNKIETVIIGCGIGWWFNPHLHNVFNVNDVLKELPKAHTVYICVEQPDDREHVRYTADETRHRFHSFMVNEFSLPEPNPNQLISGRRKYDLRFVNYADFVANLQFGLQKEYPTVCFRDMYRIAKARNSTAFLNAHPPPDEMTAGVAHEEPGVRAE